VNLLAHPSIYQGNLQFSFFLFQFHYFVRFTAMEVESDVSSIQSKMDVSTGEAHNIGKQFTRFFF
jgi:hypothetical protein